MCGNALISNICMRYHLFDELNLSNRFCGNHINSKISTSVYVEYIRVRIEDVTLTTSIQPDNTENSYRLVTDGYILGFSQVVYVPICFKFSFFAMSFGTRYCGLITKTQL